MNSLLKIIVFYLSLSFSGFLNASFLKATTVVIATFCGAATGGASSNYISKYLAKSITHPHIAKRFSSKSFNLIEKNKLKNSLELPLILAGGISAYWIVSKKI